MEEQLPEGARYLTAEDLSERFRVSKVTIWSWRRDGHLPAPVKIAPRTVRWRLTDVLAWEEHLAEEDSR